MTNHFRVPLRFSPRTCDPASIGVEIEPLGYNIEPMENIQPRFDGRLVLTPEINLSLYTCRAEIDWVCL